MGIIDRKPKWLHILQPHQLTSTTARNQAQGPSSSTQAQAIRYDHIHCVQKKRLSNGAPLGAAPGQDQPQGRQVRLSRRLFHPCFCSGLPMFQHNTWAATALVCSVGDPTDTTTRGPHSLLHSHHTFHTRSVRHCRPTPTPCRPTPHACALALH